MTLNVVAPIDNHLDERRSPAERGLPAGSYTVSISAPEPMEQTAVMGQELPPPAERIPAEYNVETRLVAEVTESGPNEFNRVLGFGGLTSRKIRWISA